MLTLAKNLGKGGAVRRGMYFFKVDLTEKNNFGGKKLVKNWIRMESKTWLRQIESVKTLAKNLGKDGAVRRGKYF